MIRSWPIKLTRLIISSWAILPFSVLCDSSPPLLPICGEIYTVSHFDLKANEKILICGGDTPGWEQIPINQAIFHLGTILQNRGYHSWSYSRENNKLIIRPGKKAKLQNILYLNAPARMNKVATNAYLTRPIDGELLSEIEAVILKQLHSIGLPCSSIDLKVDFKSGVVKANINPGRPAIVDKIILTSLNDSKPQILKRFYAINEGQLYNGDFFELSSRRIIANKMASYSHFRPLCPQSQPQASSNGPMKINVLHKTLLEKTQSVIFAGGVSTEEFPIFKIQWQKTNPMNSGLTLKAKLHTSNLQQSLTGELQSYPFAIFPRYSASPQIKVERISEKLFTYTGQQLQIENSFAQDFPQGQLVYSFTPVYAQEHIHKGANQGRKDQYLSFVHTLSFTTHYFEYYLLSPRTGHTVGAKWSSKQNTGDSRGSVDKYQLFGKLLYNYKNLRPPQLIFGWRWDLSTLKVPDQNYVPQKFRNYLGGFENLRGFERNSLNNHKLGFLTTWYMGVELRVANFSFLPWGLQPFLFLDRAQVGSRPFALGSQTFWSPGWGIRWRGPIGVFIVTSALGIEKEIRGWNHFFSYGKEF